MTPQIAKTPEAASHKKRLIFSAVVAVLILVLGTVFRPASLRTSLKTESEVTVSQAEIEQIRKIASNTAISFVSGRFAGAAQIVDPYLGVFLGSHMPFVAWKNGMAVSAMPNQPLPAEAFGVTSSGPVNMQPILNSSAFPIAAFKSDQLAVPNIALNWTPTDGASVILATRSSEGKVSFVPGSFIGAEPFSCSGTPLEELRTTVPVSARSIGSVLFDTNGTLLGLVVSCRQSAAIISALDIDGIIKKATSAEATLRARYGIASSPVPQVSKKFFDVDGLLVTNIWKGLPAADAGFLPGDIILSSKKQPIATPADLLQLLQSSSTTSIPIRRFGRRIYLHFPPAKNAKLLDAFGFDYRREEGVTLENLDVRGTLYAAGVRNGDRLLQVDGQAASPALLARLAPSVPHYFTVQIGNRLKGVFVTP